MGRRKCDGLGRLQLPSQDTSPCFSSTCDCRRLQRSSPPTTRCTVIPCPTSASHFSTRQRPSPHCKSLDELSRSKQHCSVALAFTLSGYAPIKHVWDEIERRIHAADPPQNLRNLEARLVREWTNFHKPSSKDLLTRCVDVVPPVLSPMEATHATDRETVQ